MILVAVFGFVLALGLAVARGAVRLQRRSSCSSAQAGPRRWPAPRAGSAPGSRSCVAVLVVARWAHRPARSSRDVPRRSGRLALAAFAVSSSSAIAKGELVHWQGWDFYNAPDAPVSVSFVWNAQYDGIDFPTQADDGARDQGAADGALLAGRAARRVRRRPLDRGAADAGAISSSRPRREIERVDPPGVTVKALADTHLVGAATEEAFNAGDAPIDRASTGGAALPKG